MLLSLVRKHMFWNRTRTTTKSTPFIASIENVFNDKSFSEDPLTLGITVKWKLQVNTLILMGFLKLEKQKDVQLIG